jgi:FkbM family methyltransferase
MRRVFIDCGGHQATSVRFFKAVYPDAESYEIYSFEANPNFRRYFEEHNEVKMHNVAVWTVDGEIKFYSNDGGASSVIKEKAKLGGFDKNKLSVPCIDFSGWIKNNIDITDYVVLKMDIEGAEYDVLDRMVDQGTIDYVDRLYIEWHCAKTGGQIPIQRHLRTLRNIVDRELIPYKWSAAEAITAFADGDRSILKRHGLNRPATTGREGKMIPINLEREYANIQNKVDHLLKCDTEL